jgi:hypothetical protein
MTSSSSSSSSICRKNNRRTNDGAADVNFEGTMDDKQGLLTEVPIGDEDDYGDENA